jgi:hypothetical protein
MSNVVPFPQFAAGLLVPDGMYTVAFTRYNVSTRFGRGSLELWFKVTDYGSCFERPVCRYYKVEREGKRSFRVSPHSAFNREFAAVFGRLPPAGIAGISQYRDVSVEARIRTVTKNHRQKDMPEATRYSVIDELVRRVTA